MPWGFQVHVGVVGATPPNGASLWGGFSTLENGQGGANAGSGSPGTCDFVGTRGTRGAEAPAIVISSQRIIR